MAWSVARTSSFQSSTGGYALLPYTSILVNEGGAWRPSTHKAIIPREGYYFIHVGGGVPTGTGTALILSDGDSKTIFTSSHWSNIHNGIDTMSRSGILHLGVGDELKMITQGPSYSDKQMQTIFIGFLL